MLQLEDLWNNNVFGVKCIGSRSQSRGITSSWNSKKGKLVETVKEDSWIEISLGCQTSKIISLHKCLGTGP